MGQLSGLLPASHLTLERAIQVNLSNETAQLGLWTPKAIKEGVDTRQVDENVVFNLAAQRPDLLTGGNPATLQPTPYGSVGVDINCAVIGASGSKPPTANLAPPAPGSQFPPR